LLANTARAAKLHFKITAVMYRVSNQRCRSQDHQNQGPDRQINTCVREHQQAQRAIGKSDEVIEAFIEACQSWPAASRELVSGSAMREQISVGNEDQQARKVMVISSIIKCIMHVISVHSRGSGSQCKISEDLCLIRIMQS
jgi:hypothetical protein